MKTPTKPRPGARIGNQHAKKADNLKRLPITATVDPATFARLLELKQSTGSIGKAIDKLVQDESRPSSA